MRTCIIINSHAGTATKRESLIKHFSGDAEFVEVSADDDAADRAREQINAGIERIIVAGGDGTINQVVNGVMSAQRSVVVGVYPMGTGNDLARTLAIPLDPEGALSAIDHGSIRTLDAIAARSNVETVFGVNAASGGFSGQVDDNVTPVLKSNWGPLAYLLGAAATLPEMKDYQTTIELDDQAPETFVSLNVIVANGRTIGGGKRVAPMANLEDGLLDVVVVRYGSVATMTEAAGRLVAGNFMDSEAVSHRRARRVSVTSSPQMQFNIDGEPLVPGTITFEVVPRALQFICGPDYAPAPSEFT